MCQVLFTLCTLMDLIFTRDILHRYYYCSHFTGEETEAQGSELMFPQK